MDLLSVVIASVCHDFAHDGLTNAYHVNRVSDRALAHNDQSVQENFHVAQSFKLLSQFEFNFMTAFTREEYLHFRKRMVGIILATDMSRHNKDHSTFKELLATKDITKGNENIFNIIDKTDEKKEFDSK